MLETAIMLGKKYGKPVVDNEMCCLARANPYDMSIQMHDDRLVKDTSGAGELRL